MLAEEGEPEAAMGGSGIGLTLTLSPRAHGRELRKLLANAGQIAGEHVVADQPAGAAGGGA